MSVCLCVRLSVCGYVCASAYSAVCVSVRVPIRLYVCLCVCLSVCMGVCACAHMHGKGCQTVVPVQDGVLDIMSVPVSVHICRAKACLALQELVMRYCLYLSMPVSVHSTRRHMCLEVV